MVKQDVDYVTGQGCTVSWKRMNPDQEPAHYDAWTYEGQVRKPIGVDLTIEELVDLVDEYTGCRPHSKV